MIEWERVGDGTRMIDGDGNMSMAHLKTYLNHTSHPIGPCNVGINPRVSSSRGSGVQMQAAITNLPGLKCRERLTRTKTIGNDLMRWRRHQNAARAACCTILPGSHPVCFGASSY